MRKDKAEEGGKIVHRHCPRDSFLIDLENPFGLKLLMGVNALPSCWLTSPDVPSGMQVYCAHKPWYSEELRALPDLE